MAISMITNELKLGIMNGGMNLSSDVFHIALTAGDAISENNGSIQLKHGTDWAQYSGSEITSVPDRPIQSLESGDNVSFTIKQTSPTSPVAAYSKTGEVTQFDFSGVNDTIATGFVIYHSVSKKIIIAVSFGGNKSIGNIKFSNDSIFWLS